MVPFLNLARTQERRRGSKTGFRMSLNHDKCTRKTYGKVAKIKGRQKKTQGRQKVPQSERIWKTKHRPQPPLKSRKLLINKVN